MLDSIASSAGGQRLLPFLSSSSRSPKIPPALPSHNRTPTSIDAAESIRRRAPTLRAVVLDHIAACGSHGATADEVCHALEMLPQSATPRINELAKAGAIIDSGRTRLTRSGRAAVVWIAATN